MKIQDLKNKLNKAPETVSFTDTMAVIEANYIFTPTAFPMASAASNIRC